jgi:general secretion pathway protein A
MILKHYKLPMQPFGVTPDPKFLYMSSTHREAMASLVHGILSGRGFSALIAEPGMGKTTLLFNLLHMLKSIAKTAFLFQTLCGPREFLRALLADLGIEDDGEDFTKMHVKLNEYLLRQSEQGRQVVVIIDEAQNLDEQVLEVVRMLSNFETANKKLMHVVLAGQPQLAEKLEGESLIQLRQRISIVARLAPFDAYETRQYIEHRLKLAGFASEEPLFTSQAYAKIAEHSHGIPRNINNLCFNAMSLGCALKRGTVDALMVQETIDDLDLKTLLRPLGKPESKGAGQSGRTHMLPSGSASSSFTNWRAVAIASVLLLLLCWPAYRAGLSARKQVLPEGKRSTSQQSVNQNIEKQGPAGELPWKADVGRVSQLTGTRTAGTARVVPRLEEARAIDVATPKTLQIRVQPDQSISSISMMYAGRYDIQILTDILRLNPWLKDPGGLQSGQVVRIPLDHRAARQIQSALEQNVVPQESAGEGEKQ